MIAFYEDTAQKMYCVLAFFCYSVLRWFNLIFINVFITNSLYLGNVKVYTNVAPFGSEFNYSFNSKTIYCMFHSRDYYSCKNYNQMFKIQNWKYGAATITFFLKFEISGKQLNLGIDNFKQNWPTIWRRIQKCKNI